MDIRPADDMVRLRAHHIVKAGQSAILMASGQGGWKQGMNGPVQLAAQGSPQMPRWCEQ